MKVAAFLLPAKLAAIGLLSIAAASLFAQPTDCTPIDYKILSPTSLALLTPCLPNQISNVSGTSTIASKKDPTQVLSASLAEDAENAAWIDLTLTKGSLAGSTQYTVAFAGDRTVKAFSLDIDTTFSFSIAPFNVPKDFEWFFTSHVAISLPGGSQRSCNLPELMNPNPTEGISRIKPSCETRQNPADFTTIGLLKVITGRLITKPVAIKTLKGIKSILGDDPKVDPKSRLSSPKAPASKDAASYYINFSDLAGTGASPSWALDGKISPPIGSLLHGFQISPLFTASVGQGTVPNATYSDTVDLGVQGIRSFLPKTSSAKAEDWWVLSLAPCFTNETDKEFDRDSILGVLDFGVNLPGSYDTVGRKLQKAFLARLEETTPKERANLSIDDIDLPPFGYTYDLHLFTEDGADPSDSTVKATKGTATMTLPSHGVALAGLRLHGLLQITDGKSKIKFGMFSAEVTGLGRYLIATENTVLQRKDNSLYLERLNGWKGYAKLIVNWIPDRSGHVALTGTYTNGFDAPKYNRVNSVLLGVTMKY